MAEQTMEDLQYPIGRFSRPETYSPSDLKEWISALKVLPMWMDACIENLDAPQLETPYRPGGWTVQQVVHHVADSHMNTYIRLKLALTEDNPTVCPYDENQWAELADVKLIPVNISVTMLHTIHARMVSVFENMKPEQWERTFYHPQHKTSIKLWQLAALYAWHGKHHVEHIMRLRERESW